MELNAEQQIEYDKLFKALVAQGGPKIGKLKAAGQNDPEGVARLVVLGWVNPETLSNVELTKIERDVCDETCEFADDGICSLAPERECSQRSMTFTKPTEVDDLEAANKEADKAQAEADAAIKKAEEAKAVAKSKEPLPCSRCNGDGFWHSPKTGYRAKTSSGPLIDTARTCPECN